MLANALLHLLVGLAQLAKIGAFLRQCVDEEALCTYDNPDVGANMEARLSQPFSAQPQKGH